MNNRKYFRTYTIAKITQFIFCVLLEAFFTYILVSKPTVFGMVFGEGHLFALFMVIWVSLLLSFVFLFYDFVVAKSLTRETNALNSVAYTDSLTGLINRQGLDTLYLKHTSADSISHLGCSMATLTNLLEVNESSGHAAGDALIQDFSAIISSVGKDFGTVCRNGGNDFVIVIEACNVQKMNAMKFKLAQAIEQHNKLSNTVPIKYQISTVLNEDEKHDSFAKIMTTAYAKLHKTN